MEKDKQRIHALNSFLCARIHHESITNSTRISEGVRRGWKTTMKHIESHPIVDFLVLIHHLVVCMRGKSFSLGDRDTFAVSSE